MTADPVALRPPRSLDVARAFASPSKTGATAAAPITSGQEPGSASPQLVDIARSVTGRNIAVRHKPPKNEPQRLVADSNRPSLELAWKPSESSPYTMITDTWSARAHTLRIA